MYYSIGKEYLTLEERAEMVEIYFRQIEKKKGYVSVEKLKDVVPYQFRLNDIVAQHLARHRSAEWRDGWDRAQELVIEALAGLETVETLEGAINDRKNIQRKEGKTG